MITLKELAWLAETLESKRWIFAKTAKYNPHWYTLRKEWITDSDFVNAVVLIRRYGYSMMYGKTAYIVMNVNDHLYWTMGDTLPGTILINRKPFEHKTLYDQIADKYDGLFRSPEALAENALVFQMIPDTTGTRVLDIGCGTGLFLDYRRDSLYMGIDPSGHMLFHLRKKHPNAQTFPAKFEDFYKGKFDVIVSLFGCASYIPPQALRRIPRMLNPCGSYFLMFYKSGYHPVTYTLTGVSGNYYKDGVSWLDGDKTEVGNFVVVTGGESQVKE